MSDVGLKLEFSDPETAAAFARELDRVDLGDEEFRLAKFDPKLNFDADTMVLVLKVAGGVASAVGGFLSLSTAILNAIKKPSVRIEIEGKTVELRAKASPEDIRQICDVLIRSGK